MSQKMTKPVNVPKKNRRKKSRTKFPAKEALAGVMPLSQDSRLAIGDVVKYKIVASNGDLKGEMTFKIRNVIKQYYPSVGVVGKAGIPGFAGDVSFVGVPSSLSLSQWQLIIQTNQFSVCTLHFYERNGFDSENFAKQSEHKINAITYKYETLQAMAENLLAFFGAAKPHSINQGKTLNPPEADGGAYVYASFDRNENGITACFTISDCDRVCVIAEIKNESDESTINDFKSRVNTVAVVSGIFVKWLEEYKQQILRLSNEKKLKQTNK